MNRISIVLILWLLPGLRSLACIDEVRMVYQDTILIKFGQNSQIVILVDDENDLETIRQYDINSMLDDLKISIDSMNEDETYLRIEDETGTRYLKDTSVVMESNKEEEWIDEDAERPEQKEEKDDEDDNADRKGRSRSTRGTHNYWNFELGMNNYLENDRFPDENNALYAVKPWGSWYLAVSTTNRSHLAGPLYLDWGIKSDFYNFKFQNARTLMDKDANGVIFLDDTVARDNIKSKLSPIYINGTFVPIFHFGRSGIKKDVFHWGSNSNAFRIGFGGYAGYRLGSYSKIMWEENDKKKKDKNNDNYYLNNFRYGVRFQFGFNDFDFFFNYDLNPLFIEGKGPELNAFSFGVIF